MSKSGDECEPKENDKCITMAENGHEGGQNGEQETVKKRKVPDLQESARRVKTFVDQRSNTLVIILSGIILLLLLLLLLVGLRSKCETLDLSDMCRTPSCLRSASLIVDSLNSTVPSCDDIYHYSCENWLSKHRLPSNKGRYGVKDKLRRKINKDLRHYIDLIPNRESGHVSSKMKRFYDSCIEARNQDIKYFLDTISENLYGWHMQDPNIFDTWDFTKALTAFFVRYDVDIFFRLNVETDPFGSGLPIIKIEPAELGLPVAYYQNDAQYKPFVDAYKTYMEEFLKQTGKTAQVAKIFAEDMFSFERRLAEFTPHPEEWLNSTKIFKRVRARELGVIIKRIEMVDLFQAYFDKANVNDKTIIVVVFEEYFRKLSNLITTADSKTLNNYLIWRFAMRFMRYLPNDYILLHDEFQQKLNGVEKPTTSDYDERWELCIEITYEFFHLAMTDLYIKHQSDFTAVKQDVTEIITNMTNTLLGSVSRQKWIRDSQTETKVYEKIQKLVYDVGFPNELNDDAVGVYYQQLDVRKVFFNNVERALAYRRKKQSSILKKEFPVEWPFKQLDIQSGYVYPGNHLYIGAGLVHSPIYDIHQPLSIKYGSLGFAIASQILRSITLYGLEYDEGGFLSNENNWISGKSRNTMNSSSACYESELRNSLTGTLLDSRLLMTQTYADVGALRLAYETFKKVEKEINGQGRLPGLSHTSDQLFFTSFAQSQCESVRPRYKVAKYPFETTLPGKERVEQLLKLVNAYSEAFGCGEQSSKCQLW